MGAGLVANPVLAPPAPRTTPALAAAVLSGAMVALQARLNGDLQVALGDTLLTALVSFATGLVAVVAVVACRPASRIALAKLRDTPGWNRLGGVGGAVLVAVGAAAAPRIGVALLTIGLVAGQTGGGLAVDRLGLGPGRRQDVTGPRAAGALLCLLAGVLGGGARHADPVLMALIVVAGMLIALQQALNGRVHRATGDAGVATLVNFVVGSAALLLGLAVRAALFGVHVSHWPGLGELALYAGGPIGAAYVAVAAVVVGRLGVLRLGLAITAGQLLGAVGLDAALPGGSGVPLATLVGVLLTLIAVVVSGRGAA